MQWFTRVYFLCNSRFYNPIIIYWETTFHAAPMRFDIVLFWLSCQNSNGVNFYNILTQEPDEKHLYSAGENYIGKRLCPTHKNSSIFRFTLISVLFFPLSTSSADTSPHSSPPRTIAEWADEWTNQEETGHHSPECHLGRYCIYAVDSVPFLQYFFPSSFMYCVISFVLAVCPGQAEEVFSYMAGDFMKPVVDIVDQLLTAGVNVTVYNGQLDLIVDTMGNLLKANSSFLC